uniref:C2H2-type domain-containing protein n=1 Tax=Syphacia muris TaxID=451379 RepID=A0A0N5AXY9_9BILA
MGVINTIPEAIRRYFEAMSMSDFVARHLLSLCSGTPVTELPTAPSTSKEHNSTNDTAAAAAAVKDFITNSADYTAALQLMQFQMLCQPHILNNFLAQFAQLNSFNNFSTKVIPNNNTEDTVRERKRTASRNSDDSVTKKPKASKRLAEDSETSSPVSGMFIKEASAVPPPDELQAVADLDDTAAFVDVSEESRRKIAKIENVIGDCICALCKVKYDDVFRLAQHRCPRIIHEEYRCPECEKVFSCPANLASHRRWHKPKNSAETAECSQCFKIFESKKQLKSHQQHCLQSSDATDINSNINTNKTNNNSSTLSQILQLNLP